MLVVSSQALFAGRPPPHPTTEGSRPSRAPVSGAAPARPDSCRGAPYRPRRRTGAARSRPPAYTLTASNTLARFMPSGQRMERRTSGWRKKFFSFQSPSKYVPGTAISAKAGVLSSGRAPSTAPRGLCFQPSERYRRAESGWKSGAIDLELGRCNGRGVAGRYESHPADACRPALGRGGGGGGGGGGGVVCLLVPVVLLIINGNHHLPSDEHVFVVGDCASLPYAPSAQLAEGQAVQIVEVLKKRWKGETSPAASLPIKLKGVLGSLGKKQGFGVMADRAITGRVARLLKSGIIWFYKYHNG